MLCRLANRVVIRPSCQRVTLPQFGSIASSRSLLSLSSTRYFSDKAQEAASHIAAAQGEGQVEPEDDKNFSPMSSPYQDVGSQEAATLLEGAYVLQPKKHEYTVIWLHGLGKDAHEERSMFEMVSTGNMRVVAPNPPKLPISVMNEEEKRAWFDLYETKISNNNDVEEDDVGN